MAKSFYIKQRFNPQFKKPYYVAEGQLTKGEVKAKESPIYGNNVMLEYKTEKEYTDAIAKLKAEGNRI